VIQENGQPVTFLTATIRNLFRLLDFLPVFFFLGTVIMFFHAKDKRLGDLAAGTIVVRDLQHEELRKRKQVQKWLKRFKEKHEIQIPLPDTVQESIEREDWLLLSRFIERLPSLEKQKAEELSRVLALRLGTNLMLDQNLMMKYHPTVFLVALYEKLNEDGPISCNGRRQGEKWL
jgi:hypothetical protein